MLPDDDDIDTSDIPEMTLADAARAEVRMPTHKAETVIVDSVVLHWFKTHEDDYQDTVNRLLRDYMNAHLAAASKN